MQLLKHPMLKFVAHCNKVVRYIIQWGSTLSLRTVLITSFLLQIFVIIGLTGYFSLYNEQHLIHDLAKRLRNEITLHVYQHVKARMAVPPLVNQINVDAIQIGLLDLTKRQHLTHYFFKQVQQFDTVSYIGLGTEQGEYMGAKMRDNGSVLVEIVDKTTTGHLETWETNAQGQLTYLSRMTPHYDPRKRPWYQVATQAGQAVWSNIYVYFGGWSTAISANQPIYSQQGRLLGTATADLTLLDISHFLKDLAQEQTGQIFIIERTSNLLVATSAAEKPFRVNPTTGKAEQISVTESNDPLTQATTHYLMQKFSDFSQITVDQQLDFFHQGSQLFLQVKLFQDTLGLDWLIVVMIPETHLMSLSIHARNAILLSVAALLIALLIAIHTARWTMQPIRHLNEATKAIARGQWEQVVEIARNDEIGELAHSFNTMAEQLQSSYQQLADANRTLETKVTQRTHALSETLSNLKMTQNQLIIQEKMASLGILTAGIAHELKNPLNFVNNFALLSINLVKELQETLQPVLSTCEVETRQLISDMLTDLSANLMHIYEEGQRTDRIVRGMLLHSRQRSGQRQLCDINALVQEAVQLTYHSLRSQRITFDFTIKTDYEAALPYLTVIPEDLSRVFVNLFTNAYYAMQAKQKTAGEAYQPVLSVKTQFSKAAVHIYVRDNGMGMTTAIKEKLFTPFFTTKPAGEGTGLGLSISYDIVVQGHQGKISVETEIGQYTLFTISLPNN